MQYINRGLIIIRPKQPFVDWVNAQPDPIGDGVTVEGLRSEECTAILMPEFEDPDEAWEMIEDLAPKLFEIELAGWIRVEELWPAKRDFETFKQWFDVEMHSEVADSLNCEIKKTFGVLE